jgi:hypothetical protein
MERADHRKHDNGSWWRDAGDSEMGEAPTQSGYLNSYLLGPDIEFVKSTGLIDSVGFGDGVGFGI